LVEAYREDDSLGYMICNDKMLLHLERSLSLLNPWLIHLDLDVNRLNEGQKNDLLEQLVLTEFDISVLIMNRMEFDIAEGHCQRSLAYARRFGLEGKKKITFIFLALSNLGDLQRRKGDLFGAVQFAEESYNLVVEAYDCVHPQVQEAAAILINMLIAKGDLKDAERFAEMTYMNLRDKKNGMDQDGEGVANGAQILAEVIYQLKGDLIKAEKLSREALRIKTHLHDSNNGGVGICCNYLARILAGQNKLGDETRGLFERSLAICIKNEVPDGINTGEGNINLYEFFRQLAHIQISVDLKRTHLLQAQSYIKNAHRIYIKLYGSTHPNTLTIVSRLAVISNELLYV
jgi:tetratricopeptide (TPR) repeat protein